MGNIVPIFKGVVENGKLEIQDKNKLRIWLSGLKGEIELIIRKRRKLRSLRENAYYWCVCIRIIAEEMGIDEQETHEFLKNKFLKREIQIRGKMYEVTRSTTSLSTIEMESYLENVRRWASEELSLNIPLPNEVETS